ncbi:MAG: hypothetical protein F6K09_24820, partial [Merismopedia sp. SIO2A8]|nr:hypothetical protein [Merismopedia sp. SIO2A8]
MTNKKKIKKISLSQSITEIKPALERATLPSSASSLAPTPIEENKAAVEQLTDSPSSAPHLLSSQPSNLKHQETVTNAFGIIFKAGDLIEVRSPWGTNTIAQIESIFLSPTGKTWIHYLPQQDCPQGWNWE